MRIRPAREDDAADIARIYAPSVAASVASFEEQPPAADEVVRRMALEPRLPWLVACDETVIGYAYASQHRGRAEYRWSVDVSVYLEPAAQGRGVGRALYEELIPVLADLGYVTAFAGIALPNPASVGLHEALGFTPVGVYEGVGFKQGRWVDVGWWALPLRSRPEAPPEPRQWWAE